MKIKKGDKVVILTGKDRGKQARVEKVLTSRSAVILEGLNLKQRRLRPRQQGAKGQVVAVPAPIHISNVALWCTACNRPARIKSLVAGGKRSRLCHRCNRDL